MVNQYLGARSKKWGSKVAITHGSFQICWQISSENTVSTYKLIFAQRKTVKTQVFLCHAKVEHHSSNANWQFSWPSKICWQIMSENTSAFKSLSSMTIYFDYPLVL